VSDQKRVAHARPAPVAENPEQLQPRPGERALGGIQQREESLQEREAGHG
jgi:hypothetical protein